MHVPFRAGPDSRSALISGTIQFYVYPLPAIMNLLRGGQLKALAVGGNKRSAALPNVPTTAEAGFGAYKTESWFGLIAPKGVPKQIITRFNAETVKVLKEESTRKKYLVQGAEATYGSPEQFTQMMRDEYKDLAALIKKIGMNVR